MMSPAECNAMCESKIAAAVASSAAAGSYDKTSCTPSYMENSDRTSASTHQIIHEMLAYMEGLMGPNAMMLLLLGCTFAIMLYILGRMITALFFSTGPNVRTYYHTREDDEREKIMMQNVSYFQSPSPSTSGSRRPSPGSAASSAASSGPPPPTSGPRPPPTASISSQRNGIFSPNDNRANGTTPQQRRQQQGQGQTYSSPFQSSDGTDNIYQSMSPITPLRNNGTPSSSGSQGSGGQRSPYNLRHSN